MELYVSTVHTDVVKIWWCVCVCVFPCKEKGCWLFKTLEEKKRLRHHLYPPQTDTRTPTLVSEHLHHLHRPYPEKAEKNTACFLHHRFLFFAHYSHWNCPFIDQKSSLVWLTAIIGTEQRHVWRFLLFVLMFQSWANGKRLLFLCFLLAELEKSEVRSKHGGTLTGGLKPALFGAS